MLTSELRRSRRSLPLPLVILLGAASLAALLTARPQLGSATWSSGDDLALCVAWVVAVAASAWLLGATSVCVFAVRIGRPDLARRIAGALPVGIRHLVEVAIVASCVALPALPASAAPTASSTAPVLADQPIVRAPAPVPTTTSTSTSTPTTVPAPVPTPVPAPATVLPVPARRIVVQPGDNLWLIARASLTQASTRPPTETEVLRQWRSLIDANRSTLRSGDPSLIFPGEIVTVPPATAVS